MSNGLEMYEPQKLQGRPIRLSKDGSLSMFDVSDTKKVKHYLQQIFRNKPLHLESLLKQLDLSIETKISTLEVSFITRYLHDDGKKPILVMWNGFTDKTIVDKLKIPNVHAFLNLTTNSKHLNGKFYLNLIDMVSKDVMHTVYLGEVNRRGSQLNLREAHDLVCTKDHSFLTYCHDPNNDVILTKCIFNYITQRLGFNNLVRLINK